MSPFRGIMLENVQEIREKAREVFSSHSIKLISKRAERVYANGYCVYMLYCNRCRKRKPAYKSNKEYKKRSTNCPFSLKFTKAKECSHYCLTGGVFMHNHRLTNEGENQKMEMRIEDNF